MLREHSAPQAVFRFSRLAAVVVSALLVAGIVTGAQSEEKHGNFPLNLFKTIPIPGTIANQTNGNMYSFDISWVDQARQVYYLADRSNAVVDVIDAKTAAFVGQIPGGFAGVVVVGGVVKTALSGPHGVVTGGHCLFVTDAASRVVAFDLNAS